MSPAAFPPERHIMRDLAMTSQPLDHGRHVTVAPLPDGARDRAGRPSMGFLATLADATATLASLPVARPEWTATADLSLHATGIGASGPVIVDARLVRAGSRLMVVRASVHDGLGDDADDILDELIDMPAQPSRHPLLAVGSLSFVRMPAAQSTASQIDLEQDGARRTMTSNLPDDRPLGSRVGLRVVDDHPGAVELDRSDYVVNSMGAITGGVHAIAMQAAAEARHPDLVATDLHIRFLSPARMATLRATSSPIRSDGDAVVESVEVTAQDSDDLVSIGTVGLGPAPGRGSNGGRAEP